MHVLESPVLDDDIIPAIATSGTIVRPEEAGILLVVLALWITAIVLFINRWGKIRMLEPYHPYFEPIELGLGSHTGEGDPYPGSIRGSIIKELVDRSED